MVVAPSVLSADFSDMKGAVQLIKDSGAPWVHLDVMDGNFVPNITFGPKLIADIRKYSDLFFDVHLMINNPEFYVEHFSKSGAQCITFHLEATENPRALVEKIHSFGCKAGVSIKPDTPVDSLNSLLDCVDLILIMSVNPGFGGQSLIPSTLEKVKYLSSIGNRKYLVSIDGGVNSDTIGAVYVAGADVVVTGSAFFKAEDHVRFVNCISNGLGGDR